MPTTPHLPERLKAVEAHFEVNVEMAGEIRRLLKQCEDMAVDSTAQLQFAAI